MRSQFRPDKRRLRSDRRINDTESRRRLATRSVLRSVICDWSELLVLSIWFTHPEHPVGVWSFANAKQSGAFVADWDPLVLNLECAEPWRYEILYWRPVVPRAVDMRTGEFSRFNSQGETTCDRYAM